MAYNLLTGAILEVQYRCTLEDQQCINTFHYRLTDNSDDGGAAATGMAQNFVDNLGEQIRLHQTVDAINIEARAQWVYPTRYMYKTQHPVVAHGAAAAPCVSIGTSVVIRRRAELAGPSNRGRIFIPGAPVADTTIGGLLAAAHAAWDADVAAGCLLQVTDAGTGAVAVPVLWSPARPDTFEFVDSTDVDWYLRYQRRREVGRGQ